MHMRLPVSLVALIAISITSRGAVGNLAAWTDRDLRTLSSSESEQFAGAFHETTGVELESQVRGVKFEAWFVKPFRSGNANWVFLEVYPGYNTPDVSGVRVHVFDEDWNRILTTLFPTGYRFFLEEADIIGNESLSQDLLVVRLSSSGPFVTSSDGDRKSAFESGDFQRQYYAFTSDRMALVRLEDDKGNLVANQYTMSPPMKGGPVPTRTSEEWIGTLSSDSRAEQLATLVWLSGEHLSSAELEQENPRNERIEDSRLYEAVRDSPKTQNVLERLGTDESEWIRAYTEMVGRVVPEN